MAFISLCYIIWFNCILTKRLWLSVRAKHSIKCIEREKVESIVLNTLMCMAFITLETSIGEKVYLLQGIYWIINIILASIPVYYKTKNKQVFIEAWKQLIAITALLIVIVYML